MIRRLMFSILILCLMPSVLHAQWDFDLATIEAYINDHKKQRSLLLSRSTLEHSNKLLHQYSCEEVVEYGHLNFELDRYTRAFDVIDVMYQSLRTALNVKGTYNTVRDRIGDYRNLLSDFNEQVVKRKHIVPIDTMILSINARAIRRIADEGEYLFKSMGDLILYVTGAAACSASDLMIVLDAINCSMDNIELHINRSYYETWRFIQLRMGYWKSKIYVYHTRQQIVDDAFGRWRNAGFIFKD